MCLVLVYVYLLRDILSQRGIKIRAGQSLPKIVIFFIENFREARRLCDVIALSQGPRYAIRKFALERPYLKKKLSVVPGYISRLVYEPHDGETRLDILTFCTQKIPILRELSPAPTKTVYCILKINPVSENISLHELTPAVIPNMMVYDMKFFINISVSTSCTKT